MLWLLLLALSLTTSDSRSLNIDVQRVSHAVFRVSLTNSDPSPLTMLVWNTPFDDHREVFRANMFDIVHSTGTKAMYTGIIMKRYPTLADFITIRPGQTIETTLDLHLGYNFPLTGAYKMTLNTHARIFDGDVSFEKLNLKTFEVTEIMSETIELNILHASAPWSMNSNTTVLGSAGAPVLVNCDTGDSNLVLAAAQNATWMADEIVPLAEAGCTTARYTTWFGACDSTGTNRAGTVKQTTSNIQARDQAGWRADCSQKGCGGRSTYAYVYPSDTTFTVHLCYVFFNGAARQLCATDSCPGTLIHELSHFDSVGKTQDYAYGQTNCKNLAISNPANAVMNADNYEYYAETCVIPA